MPTSEASTRTAASSRSMTQSAPSPMRKSRERSGQRRVMPPISGRAARARALLRTGSDELVKPQLREVGVGDLVQCGQRDPALTILVLVYQPVEENRDLLAVVVAEASLSHRLAAPAAVEVDRRKAARQGL